MAKYKLKVSGDNMVASIVLTDDGAEPYKEEIYSILENNEIVYGIQEDVISDIVQNPIYEKEYSIAYGVGPKNGEKGRLELRVKKKENKSSEKYINMRERSSIISLEEDDLIAEIIPATKGEPGKDVYGNEIEGLKGQEPKVVTGKNTKVEQGKIYAATPGELIFKRENENTFYIDVSKVHTIKGDVDYSTGNVRFPGKVIIKGNVKPGFVVEAEEDIEIEGVVEAATLISGGTIIVNGIKGGSKGIIKAERLETNYVENEDIEVEKDVIIRQSSINSLIKAGEKIEITDKNGRISGGTLMAGNRISAAYIGSRMSVKTSCEVGVPPTLNEEMTVLESQIALDVQNLKKLSMILKGLMKLKKEKKLDKSKVEQYRKTVQTAKELKSHLSKNELHLERLQKSIKNSKQGGEIIAKEVIYPGAEVMIHKKKFFPNKEITKVRFILHEEKIIMKGFNEENEN
ncbi:MAG: DUF342 domain-containing protein [Thermotogota bacterium]